MNAVRYLKLYAPPIALVLLAGLVQLVPNTAAWITIRLVVLGLALAISIREQRRSR